MVRLSFVAINVQTISQSKKTCVHFPNHCKAFRVKCTQSLYRSPAFRLEYNNNNNNNDNNNNNTNNNNDNSKKLFIDLKK